MNVTIVGSGAFGAALAIALHEESRMHVSVVCETQGQKELLEQERKHPTYPHIPFPQSIDVVTRYPEKTDVLILALPAQIASTYGLFLKENKFPNDVPIVLTSKGICKNTGHVTSDLMKKNCLNPLFLLSGPNFAVEIAGRQFSKTMLVGEKTENCIKLASTLSSPHLKVTPYHDMVGVQVCGSLKNIMAIGSGMLIGMKQGENAQAALIEASLSEIEKWIAFYGGDRETMRTPAGVGDLILTATGSASRNRQFGIHIGENKSADDWHNTKGTLAEGFHTLQALKNRWDQQFNAFPITHTIYRILFESAPKEEIYKAI